MCFLQGARKAPSKNGGDLGGQQMEELEGTVAITQGPPMNLNKETEPHRGQVLPEVTDK